MTHRMGNAATRLEIQPKELKDWLASPTPPRLLDVRTTEEQAIARIKGAIPVSQELVKEVLNSWPRDAAIVTYCHHGVRSLEAASFLLSRGFTNVRSLAGGIDAWAVQVDRTIARY
jgi:rhodanese-related sulfurtransferase